jgi:hypothetical protein
MRGRQSVGTVVSGTVVSSTVVNDMPRRGPVHCVKFLILNLDLALTFLALFWLTS